MPVPVYLKLARLPLALSATYLPPFPSISEIPFLRFQFLFSWLPDSNPFPSLRVLGGGFALP
jgi:hypothetical protein